MATVLEFSLGIEISEFLRNIGVASSATLSLASIAETVGMGFEHLNDAINEGAALRGLSSATGESVARLYQFRQGLEAIGGQTESLPMFFMEVQKALSGVNELGQRTDILFTQLGLSLANLRAMDTIDALTTMAGALSKLNPNQAAGVAEQLFGRFQAQSILQMMRNMPLFSSASGESANTGALLQKFADSFELVKKDAAEIESDFLGIWVSIAGNITPSLDQLSHVRLSARQTVRPYRSWMRSMKVHLIFLPPFTNML